MLNEISSVRQDARDYFRRWFNDASLDLYIWYDNDYRIIGFQLCYDKDTREYALTYIDNKGFSHDRIDSGEYLVWDMKTPVLKEHVEDPCDHVIERFIDRSCEVDQKIRQYIVQKLEEYAKPSSLLIPDQQVNPQLSHH